MPRLTKRMTNIQASTKHRHRCHRTSPRFSMLMPGSSFISANLQHTHAYSSSSEIYRPTLWVKKTMMTWLLIITLTNVDRFLKFFHWQIPKETNCGREIKWEKLKLSSANQLVSWRIYGLWYHGHLKSSEEIINWKINKFNSHSKTTFCEQIFEF